MRVARPRARGRQRLQRRALVGEAGRDEEFFGELAVVVLGVGNSRVEHLADVVGDAALGELQDLGSSA